MKKDKFVECFRSEIQCWEALTSKKEVGGVVCHKSFKDTSHFSNIVYIKEKPFDLITDLSLKRQVLEFYSDSRNDPFIMLPVDSSQALDDKTYAFFCSQHRMGNVILPSNMRISENESLDLFCEVLVNSFSLDRKFETLFRKKMEHAQKVCASRFIILFVDNKPVGIVSLFAGRNKKNHDANFMMNLGVLKSEQRKGYGRYLIDYCYKTTSSIFVRTNNPALAKKVFPSFGFELCGKFQFKKLKNEKS